MRALRDGARTQGDRKGSPLLETAWQADPPVYSRGWACPCPAALHSFFHSPAASFMVARRALLPLPLPMLHLRMSMLASQNSNEVPPSHDRSLSSVIGRSRIRMPVA